MSITTQNEGQVLLDFLTEKLGEEPAAIETLAEGGKDVWTVYRVYFEKIDSKVVNILWRRGRIAWFFESHGNHGYVPLPVPISAYETVDRQPGPTMTPSGRLDHSTCSHEVGGVRGRLERAVCRRQYRKAGGL